MLFYKIIKIRIYKTLVISYKTYEIRINNKQRRRSTSKEEFLLIKIKKQILKLVIRAFITKKEKQEVIKQITKLKTRIMEKESGKNILRDKLKRNDHKRLGLL